MNENVIEMKNILKDFGSFAVRIPCLEIKKGYITGLVGQNGAGKTTLIKLILGLLPMQSGEMKIFGEDVWSGAPDRREIALVSESPHFLKVLTTEQVHDQIAPFYPNWSEEIYRSLIAEFEIPNIQIQKLSKGQGKIFSIIMALAQQPKLLILDEPTANLDPVVRHRLLAILKDLMQDEERSILFSTHITSDLEMIGDYLVGMRCGEISFCREKDEMLDTFTIVQGPTSLLSPETEEVLSGVERSSSGFIGLCSDREMAKAVFGDECVYRRPTIDEIMIYTVMGGR